MLPAPPLSAALRTPSVGVARLLQVLGGDVLGLLLVDVDAGVELLHDLERQALLDLLDRGLVVGSGVLGDLQALGRAIEQRIGRPVVEIDPRALVRIAAESGSGGERAAIAAPLGVLLRERVG